MCCDVSRWDLLCYASHETANEVGLERVVLDRAACLLLLGQPKQALARAARIDGLPFELGDNQAVTALVSETPPL